ncbi:hypothetical protein B0H11DRAFT_2318641 [Mycena galericulata]|nr:hypothetical protein B0H11DRAFT_2318641 [Mycena galericulata]
MTSPYQFSHRLPHEVSRITNVVEKSHTSYVLLVDGVDPCDADPQIDWSRYLPPEVPLDRRKHDKCVLPFDSFRASYPLSRILSVSFRFFTMFGLRLVPSLFLKDMHRSLSVSRSQPPPKTPHYSPMLHNALLAVSAVFSDDPHIRDPKTRHFFATTAKSHFDSECQKPGITLVQSLGLLGTYYADKGDRIVGDSYFGKINQSRKLSVPLVKYNLPPAVGLGVDSKAWVKAGLLTHDEMVDRNWAHWNVFCMDVCWALFYSRDFGSNSGRHAIAMPFVDSDSDQIPWYYAPANIPPQPNFLSLAFFETSSLFVIAQKIIGVVYSLCTVSIYLLNHLTRSCSLELNNWKSRLPPQLDITLANRAKSTPQRLMLHCAYWWCTILLHRPFFNRRARPIQHSDRDIDHDKLCKRAAENILELAETYSSLYTLPYAPVTMLQVLYSAATVFLLLALQSTSNLRIAQGSLRTALAQVELCVRYMHEMGQTWLCAARTADILTTVLQDKLRPIIARRLAQKGVENLPEASAPAFEMKVPAPDLPIVGEQDAAKLLPSATAADVSGWPRPQDALDSEDWSEMSVFTQAVEVEGFGDSLNQLAGENMFPDFDSSGFFPTFDSFGAPEFWAPPESFGIDSSFISAINSWPTG